MTGLPVADQRLRWRVSNWLAWGAPRLVDAAPGVLVAVAIAVAAHFGASVTPLPAVLIALLIGAMISDFARRPRYAPGAALASRTLLRVGVGLLGAKISLAVFFQLGWFAVATTLAGVVLTLGVGALIGRACGLKWDHAALAAGAVAICGASAALAISAVLPKRQAGEGDAAGVIAAVTVVGAVAMAAYPLLAASLGLDAAQTGIFLGGAIHEVAQAVGAGYGVSEDVGIAATTVKLLRVACLAPAVMILGLLFRVADPAACGAARPPIMPWFLVMFLVLAGCASLGILPAPLVSAAGELSRWSLLIAIGALGMSISLRRLATAGARPIVVVLLQSSVLLAVVLGTILLTHG